MKDLRISMLGDIYGGLLTEKQRDMLRDYFDYDLSLGEIAEQCGISRQAVADSVKTVEKTLCRYEETLKLAERRESLRKRVLSIVGSLDEGDADKALQAAKQLLAEL